VGYRWFSISVCLREKRKKKTVLLHFHVMPY